MKFRAPDEPIRIALTSGHVTIVGSEWIELNPIFHADALHLGCECDQERVRAVPVEPAVADADAGYDGVYREALIAMIGRDEPADFTKDGLPNTNVVSKLAGVSARKEDVLRVFRAMKDEANPPE